MCSFFFSHFCLRSVILSSPSASSLSLAMSLSPFIFLSSNFLSYVILSHHTLSYLITPIIFYQNYAIALSLSRDDPQLYRAPLTPYVLSTHERIEELLESHLLDVESLEAKLSYLLKTLQNAEASVCTYAYVAYSIKC